MVELNMILIILYVHNTVDIRLIYRCLNVSILPLKAVILKIVKNIKKKTFEKKEC